MKKLLTLLLLIFLTTILYSQSNYQDVVYLKNGSIIRGIIIKQVPSESIKIETSDRNIFFYEMDEIEKATKEPKLGEAVKFNNNSKFKRGYIGIVELNYLFGVGNHGLSRIEANIINGYQFNPYFSLGLGTGLRWYMYESGSAIFIPIFADFRAIFKDKKISPYLSLGLGYSIDASSRFSGVGVLLKPSFGVSFKVSDKTKFHTGIGYELQRLNYGNSLRDVKNAGGFGFNFGVSF
jgi:hypothetical protein